MSETTDGHTGGLQRPVHTKFGLPDCAVRGCDPWSNDDNAEMSAGRAGRVPCAETAAEMAGRADRSPELEGESVDRGRRLADPKRAQAKCEPAERRQCKDLSLYDGPGRLAGANRTPVKPPERDGTRCCARELRHSDAYETLTVGHADVEGEFRDVRERLEALVCRTVGVHKVRDACEVLDAGEVLDEGVAYEDGEETTHLCPRSSDSEANVRFVCNALEGRMIREDAASKDAQRRTMRRGAEAYGGAGTTDGYASRDNADTCTKGKGCKVDVEQYEWRDSPARPECAARCSGHRRGRRDSGRARRGACACALPVSTRYPFFDDGIDAWTAAVRVFKFSDLLFFDFSSCLWFCTTGLSEV